ncbi:MAG: hypothetical protein MI747_24240 [Desulfobacterales bacterium]|nr:hypothetical protein [Desulfobacterales bacterium]
MTPFERYVREHAPVIFMEMDGRGRILEMNEHGRVLLGRNREGTFFSDVILDFQNQFSLGAALAHGAPPQLITLDTRNRRPESFEFIFRRAGDGVLAFGHRNVADQDLLGRELLAMNQELNHASRAMNKQLVDLERALENTRALQSDVLPICMHCSRIRNRDERWERLEHFFAEHGRLKFSHGICPDCLIHHYPDHKNRLN